MSLKWIDINFNNSIIYLRSSVTKSKKNKQIPLDAELLEKFRELKKKTKSQYVFCDNDGRELKNIRHAFEVALKKANITDFRFHDLRHTFASQMVMAGIDIRTVSELMGHSTIRMTEKYSHLSPNHKRAAMDTFSTIYGNNMATCEKKRGNEGPPKSLNSYIK